MIETPGPQIIRKLLGGKTGTFKLVKRVGENEMFGEYDCGSKIAVENRRGSMLKK